MPLDEAQRRELLSLARESIDSALRAGDALDFPQARLRPALMEPQSSFVTLRIGQELRGCCGTIEVSRPLAEDIWHNARSSAFKDPRFPPLTIEEWTRVHLHVSVLSTPEALPVATEQELLAKLRPHVDGLILEHGAARATFLPSVWEQIDDPARFVRQLKLKAGWPADFWSPQLRIRRYSTESFGEEGG